MANNLASTFKERCFTTNPFFRAAEVIFFLTMAMGKIPAQFFSRSYLVNVEKQWKKLPQRE